MSVAIDMALTALARIHGPQLAQMVQLAVEYEPRPPLDAGSPSKAPAQMAGLRAIIAHHAAVPAPPGGHSGGHADAADGMNGPTPVLRLAARVLHRFRQPAQRGGDTLMAPT